LRRIATQILGTLLTLVGAAALLFVAPRLVPGSAAEVLLGPRATPELVADFERRMGLDRPVHEQLVRSFGQVLRGDLGVDLVSGRPIVDLIGEVLPFTIVLAFSSLGLALLLGVPLGAWTALRPGSLGDRVAASLSVGVIAVPNFVVAVLLLLIFSLWVHWLPVMGAGEPGRPLDQLLHLVLPVVSLAIGWVGYLARLVRASLLEVIDEPFIQTHRAYGASEARIVLLYALRNACLPTVAVLGLGVGRLLGGAIFAEVIFARPGIGRLIYDAIATRNYPVVQAGVLVVVLLFTLTNMLADLLYAALDPRTRRGGDGEAA
jgi:peptide/nickel transport system permease protein